ncbi:MAG TPA: hypothetical protein VLI71_18300 [Gammaproteobacteria bacterium]|nr:hypothetical protein [Gammaproteobacteria bacterium]
MSNQALIIGAARSGAIVFSFDSGWAPYPGSMLSPRPKTKRFLEKIQIVLTFASVCTVADASFAAARPHDPAGYYAAGPRQGQARADGLIRELARTERKRREDALKEALEQRPLRA